MMHPYLYCEACGASNETQARTCFACGHPLQANSRGTNGRAVPYSRFSQGVLLRHRYHIISQVGKGGFGAVYKAADTQFGNRPVAIKEMSQSDLSPQDVLKATEIFKREALMLAGLRNPHLPSIYEHFIENGHWYLVMDFIEGQTLEQYLNRTRTHSLPLEKVLNIGIQLCKVLDYLHMRHPPIIFRDLKPSNVMLTSDGDIYLIDFGIARHFKPGQVKDTIAFGSLGYAAPEQYGNTQTTPRADIYSLGVLLHQLLSGHDPLTNTPNTFTFPPLHLHGQPPMLEELIMQMLELNPLKRPASIADVGHELEGIAAEETARQRAYRHPTIHPIYSRKPPSVGTTLCTYTGHYHGYPYPVTSVAWSPDGTHIASTSTTVQVWHALTGDTILTYRGHTTTQTLLSTVAWSPDGTLIASAGGDERIVQIWHTTNGGTIGTYRGHAKSVNALAWNPAWGTGTPDGSYIASASNDGTVQVWDVMTLVNGASKVTSLKYHGHTHFWRWKSAVNTLAWSPDGSYIASGGTDKTVQVWNAGQPLQHNILIYRGHALSVSALAWSADGTLIASGSADGTVQVWDSGTGDLIFTYQGHAGSGLQAWVNAVAWSPDGMRIASASGGGEIHVWDALDGGNVITYGGHTDLVNALAWNPVWGTGMPNESCIASASQDGTVHVWRAA